MGHGVFSYVAGAILERRCGFQAIGQAFPIVALSSPLREGPALARNHPCTSVEVSKAERKRPAIEGSESDHQSGGGAGLSPAAGPLFSEVIFDRPTMSTLSFCEEDLELVKDFFVWPHPTDSSKALLWWMVWPNEPQGKPLPRVMRVSERPCPNWVMRSPWLLGWARRPSIK